MIHQVIAKWIATGFGIGYVPVAPGTFGTLLALPLTYVFMDLSLAEKGFLYALLCVISYVAVRVYEASINSHDPSVVVVDEILGLLAIFVILPITFVQVVIAFVLFRLLDILKPGPVGWVEKTLSQSSMGTLLDDVVAGGLVIVILELINYQMSFV